MGIDDLIVSDVVFLTLLSHPAAVTLRWSALFPFFFPCAAYGGACSDVSGGEDGNDDFLHVSADVSLLTASRALLQAPSYHLALVDAVTDGAVAVLCPRAMLTFVHTDMLHSLLLTPHRCGPAAPSVSTSPPPRRRRRMSDTHGMASPSCGTSPACGVTSQASASADAGMLTPVLASGRSCSAAAGRGGGGAGGGPLGLLSYSIGQLGIGTFHGIASVGAWDSVGAAVSTLHQWRLTVVPVVDGAGAVIEVFSASDLLRLFADVLLKDRSPPPDRGPQPDKPSQSTSALDDLVGSHDAGSSSQSLTAAVAPTQERPPPGAAFPLASCVRDVMAARRPAGWSVATCGRGESLGQVLERFRTTGHQTLFSLDAAGRLDGVVALVDVMRFLIV